MEHSMTRDHSPLDRCRECGAVLRVLIFDHGLDDDGNEYKAIWAEVVPHPRPACAAMQALAREEWPTLW
jgi:hypothetical protein